MRKHTKETGLVPYTIDKIPSRRVSLPAYRKGRRALATALPNATHIGFVHPEGRIVLDNKDVSFYYGSENDKDHFCMNDLRIIELEQRNDFIFITSKLDGKQTTVQLQCIYLTFRGLKEIAYVCFDDVNEKILKRKNKHISLVEKLLQMKLSSAQLQKFRDAATMGNAEATDTLRANNAAASAKQAVQTYFMTTITNATSQVALGPTTCSPFVGPPSPECKAVHSPRVESRVESRVKSRRDTKRKRHESSHSSSSGKRSRATCPAPLHESHPLRNDAFVNSCRTKLGSLYNDFQFQFATGNSKAAALIMTQMTSVGNSLVCELEKLEMRRGSQRGN